MMGTQEMVGLGRMLMGSVSHHCLSHASCSVVAVPAVYPVVWKSALGTESLVSCDDSSER